MNFEEEDIITEEEQGMSYELITEVEKAFINLTRNFRSQIWLKHYLLNCIDETVEDMVNISLEEMAYTATQKLIELGELTTEESFHHFSMTKETPRKVMTEEEFKDLYDCWKEQVQKTINSDIVDIDKSTESML